ncbi:MAG: DEAD/DEAH box helicase [Candidatus Omnitrophica bacterium]|nr:DEAD/DEAH box helicase [Candidatus Omnitrophota bacterium]
MPSIAQQLGQLPGLNQVIVPDLWQQQAVAALRNGQDVVVQAPTGAGKTLIFELWSNQGKNRSQAIYTVPTRALANDKLAEWRARGWDVGIATGDLAENLGAPILVATLETQKNRLIQGEGPAMLVVDEYQMLGDADRGLNYELALALAPRKTQLLLLSGSVANPQDVVKWLQRLGRSAVLVRNEIRPVPLEEVDVEHLSYYLPSQIRNHWPRLVAKALAEDLGPILIFAPRRQAAESLAAELARSLPTPNPLQLSPEQRQLAGEHLAKILKGRIAYHHSGLSYGARAGVVEPLAKAGQLRVVVATMGLAAGINFSLRSVALAGESYRRDDQEQLIRPDEILQMFGRAGRRGIDETGFALITSNQIRIRDGYPAHLSRSAMVDWSAMLGLMAVASRQDRNPFEEAVRVQKRLFSSKPINLGVEESIEHPDTPCGLKTDAERARHVRKKVRQMLNSKGQWEPFPPPMEIPLGEVFIAAQPGPETSQNQKEPPDTNPAAGRQFPPELRLRSALSEPAAVDKIGQGQLALLAETGDGKVYGRIFTVADRIAGDRIVLVKWIRRLINWNGTRATLSLWHDKIAPLVEDRLRRKKMTVARFEMEPHRILALVSLEEMTVRVPVDSLGVAIWKPLERAVMPADCARCSLVQVCCQLSPATGVAMLWRRLGLVDASGSPTRRGMMVSFFSQGDGLAIAAALEDTSYPLADLVYDVANLEASFRFCGDEHRWGGRLALACQHAYGLISVPGYLEAGVPPKYGAGAEQVVAAVHKNPSVLFRSLQTCMGQ